MKNFTSGDFKTKAGQIGIVRAKNFVAKGIMFYSRYFEKIPECYLASHCFICDDNNVIYESNKLGNQDRFLSKYDKLNCDYWIFENINLTPENTKIGMAHAIGALGRFYDFPGLFSFPFKFIPQLKYADFCSEYMSRTVRGYMALPFCGYMPPEKISPARGLQYGFTKGKSEGWVLKYEKKGDLN